MDNSQSTKRRSVVHFFIKPKLQIKFTLLFIFVAIISSFSSLFLVYVIKTIDVDGLEGLRTAWYYLKVTFPGLWVPVAVSLVAGLIVGISASRKVALPIYKVEQWSHNLKNGNLNERLGMRDSDFWGEMADTCNAFTGELREDFEKLKAVSETDAVALHENLNRIFKKYSI